MSGVRQRFDDRYYQRFYGTGGAHDQAQIDHLATGVHHMAAWWSIDIRSVLDVGAGMGFWRDWYRTNHPRVKVRSIDISPYACATWGHERRDISQWRPPGQYDLVVCHSVLQYLDDDKVTRAIEHLGDATRQLLYLELPTRADLKFLIDPTATDLEVFHRTGKWYRAQLELHFRQVGAGMWVPRQGVPMYELEAAGR